MHLTEKGEKEKVMLNYLNHHSTLDGRLAEFKICVLLKIMDFQDPFLSSTPLLGS